MKLMYIRQDRLMFYKNRLLGTGLESHSTASSFFGHLKNLIRDYLGVDSTISTSIPKDQNTIPELIVSFKGTPKTKIITMDFRKSRLEKMILNPSIDENARNLRKRCYTCQLDTSLIILTDFLCFWIIEPNSIADDPDIMGYNPVQIMQKLPLFQWDEHDLFSLSLIPDAPIVLKMLINLIHIYADVHITKPTDLYDSFIPFLQPSLHTINLPTNIQQILENPESPEELQFQNFLYSLLNEIHAYLTEDQLQQYGIHLNNLFTHLIIENILASWRQFNQESPPNSPQSVFYINHFAFHIPIDSEVITYLPDGNKSEKIIPAIRTIETAQIPVKLLNTILKVIEKCLNNTDYHVLIRSFNFNDPFYHDLYKKIKATYERSDRNSNRQNDFITGIINSINVFLSEKSVIRQWIADPEICYALILEGYLIPSLFHLF